MRNSKCNDTNIKKKVSIITHLDGDGVCSAAIILQKYPEAELFFARPNTLAEKLELISKSLPELIYILDISLSDPKARKLVKKIAKTTKVTIIDHHPNPMLNKYINIIWSDSKSSSQLASEVVIPNSYLATLGAQCDGYVSLPEYRKDAGLLYYTLKIFDDALREYITRNLAKGLKVNQIPGIVKKATSGQEKIKKILDVAERRQIVITPILSIIELNEARGFGSIIAQRLANKKKKIILIMHDEGEKIGFTIRKHRSIPIDVGKMANILCKRLGGSGGGHPGAAGGGVPSKNKEEFIKLIMNYLDSAAN